MSTSNAYFKIAEENVVKGINSLPLPTAYKKIRVTLFDGEFTENSVEDFTPTKHGTKPEFPGIYFMHTILDKYISLYVGQGKLIGGRISNHMLGWKAGVSSEATKDQLKKFMLENNVQSIIIMIEYIQVPPKWLEMVETQFITDLNPVLNQQKKDL